MTYPQPPSGSSWPNPPQQPKKPRLGLWARIGLIFGGIVVFGVTVGLSSQDDPAPVAQSAPATRSVPTYTAPTYSPPTYSAPVAPVVPDGTITNGTYEIGTEVAPGKYKSPGPESGLISLCYVDVQQGEKFLLQEVSNDGQVRIEIKSSWAGALMEVSGCQPFAKVG